MPTADDLLTASERHNKNFCACVPVLVSVKCCFTFQPDHQRHFELQLSASFGDAVGNDGTINNAPKNVDQDGFNL